jgi:signal transduction histidine kinase
VTVIDPSSASVAMPVMEDGPSVALFVVAVVAVSIVAALVLPPVLRRLPLRYGVPVLALVGPALAIVASLIGTGAMTLSGRDIWYALLVAACSGAAAIVVGLRLARPIARDLDVIARAVDAVAEGDRSARTQIERGDEIGKLAATVDELSRSLARAETERRAADEERRSVVSALSHDLRTPLASLLVSVDALADGVGESADHICAIRGNVLALERLVGDLFLLARADSGSLALDYEPLDLAELIDEAVEAVEPLATTKGVRFTTELDGPIPVIGDDGALGRVLRNLFDNAIRFSPEDGVVTIENRSTESELRIAVVDEGPGFPKSFVAHAFDRFTQADDARSAPGGAGLGLAIARTLVEAHGGSIEIVSRQGGDVTIHLPPTSPAPRAELRREGWSGRSSTGEDLTLSRIVDTDGTPPAAAQSARATEPGGRIRPR